MAHLLTGVAWLAVISSSLQLGVAIRVGHEDTDVAQPKPPPPGLPPSAVKNPPAGMPPSAVKNPPAGMPPGAQQSTEPLLDAEEEESARSALKGVLEMPMPNSKYSLEDEMGTGTAVWKLQTTYSAKSTVPTMTVTYKGQREGWDSVEHDFDVQVPGTNFGYSVVFRDIKLNSLGIGNHFYKKFAILPLGETDKAKSAYTVRMDTPHFNTGAKVWKVSRGYCKAILGIINNCHGNKDATAHPIRSMYCSASASFEWKKDIMGADVAPRGWWKSGTPQHCSWQIPDGPHLPLTASIFEDGPNVVSVDKELEPEKGKPTSDFETYLFLTITTALKQAYLMGGSGN